MADRETHLAVPATRHAPIETGGPVHSHGVSADDAQVEEVRATGERMAEAINDVMQGKPEVVRTVLTTLFAEGHVLLEDVPGVGKTLLAKALARSIDASMRRIQFTPDLLPSDITGVSVFNQDTRRFEFRPGAVFANVVVGDEINRASPKTQSALLEAMEESQVTIDGTTYHLARPFIVLATQNPIEMEGTYPLPEAQRDRFMTRVSVGYPSAEQEREMLERHTRSVALDELTPVVDAETVARLITVVRGVYAAPALQDYVVALARATRQSPALRLGASPRASLQLLRAAKAHAALAGRDHTLPDDVQAVAVPVLAHRLLLTGESFSARRSEADIVAEILAHVPVPAPRP